MTAGNLRRKCITSFPSSYRFAHVLYRKLQGNKKKKLRRDADFPPYRALDLILADEMKALEVQKIACMLSLHDS